jgi:carbamate kinase
VAQAYEHRVKDGWQVRDEGGGRFRRVVPSPLPRKIIEMPAIERLVEAGQIVVCCGGGGIPITIDSLGRVRGVAAVIDKDRTTGLLARHLAAPTLVILTAVERACLNFGHTDEISLDQISADEAERHLNGGHFRAGSMRPKIETAIDFVRGSVHADATAIIAHVNRFADALDGNSGTRIVRPQNRK